MLRELKVSIKLIQAPIIAGLLLLTLILPQLTLADGPTVENVVVLNTTATTATIFWTTNTTSDSWVYYGTNTTALNLNQSDSSMVTTHFMLLEDLSSTTTYYFEVQSGTSVNNNSGSYYQFTTLAPTVPPIEYSITLNPACGICGELIKAQTCSEVIGVTATVATAGIYHICWDSPGPWDPSTAKGVVVTFTTGMPGVYEAAFPLPEAKKGNHDVYLTNAFYDDLGTNAHAIFEVFPSVKITPENGPVGTSVTLNGYGFNNGQAIQVKFNNNVITPTPSTLAANTMGSWSFNYTIPDTPSGSYIFEIDVPGGPAGWEDWASKSFKVIPSITATPTLGTVGQTIAVSGKGFASKEEGIKVTFDGDVVSPYIPPANGNGSWSTVITVPPRTCGSYSIDASGTLTRARDVTDLTFTVVAGVSVDPISAYVGDTIKVTGGGFVAGETGIQVYFDNIPQTTTTITARLNGCWESSFTLPISTYGIHTVSATGDTTTAVRAANLTTQAQIIATSFNNGAPGDLISLTGNGYHGSQKLTVTIGGIAAPIDAPNTTQINGNVAINFHVPKGSTEGQRILAVTDEGGATDLINFTVTKKTLSITPLPISPKNSTLRSGQVTFQWQGVTSVTGYAYTLEISRTAGSTPFWSKPDIQGSSYTLHDTGNVTETLQPGTYYWRVKIVDNYGNDGPWSEFIKFTVSPIPTWVWVVIGLVVLIVLMVVAYRETKFKVTE